MGGANRGLYARRLGGGGGAVPSGLRVVFLCLLALSRRVRSKFDFPIQGQGGTSPCRNLGRGRGLRAPLIHIPSPLREEKDEKPEAIRWRGRERHD